MYSLIRQTTIWDLHQQLYLILNQHYHLQLNSHSRRSLQSRKRRNKKRNYTHRLSRYRYCVVRVVYYRFKWFSIKKMLRDMSIRFIHIQKDKNRLFIGVKNFALRDQCYDRLPHCKKKANIPNPSKRFRRCQKASKCFERLKKRFLKSTKP
jgi:hypothetical protein